MPNWETFYIDYSPSEEERTALEIELQRQQDRMISERYQGEQVYEKLYELMSGQYYDKEQQAICEVEEQLKKEKERYPLFFWKENI